MTFKAFMIIALGVPISLGACLIDGNSLGPVAAISLGFLLIGMAVALLRPGLLKDMIAFAAIGQPIAFTAALAGNSFQLDTHMLFFAVTATLVSLNAVRPLVFATLIVAAHHVGFTVLLPTFVYPDGAIAENIMRSLFHGVVLAMETTALIAVVLTRQKMTAALAQERDAADQARQAADENAAKAQALAVEAEEKSQHTEELAEEARRARLAAEKDKDQIKSMSDQMAQEAAAAEQTQLRLREELQSVLDALQVGLSNLAAGNLTVTMPNDLPSEYREVAHDFTAAVDQLRSTIALMVDNTQTVRGEAEAITSATSDLNSKTQEQNAILERSVAAIEALTAELTSASKTAGEAADVTRRVQQTTDDSRNIVEKAALAIERIEATSGDISKITSVIDNISFQTNLLALNAGVEAARAGEAGQGFAVVAAEVRNLAMRSSEAAQEIRDLIGKSEHEVNDGVEHVRQTVASLMEVGDAVSSAARLVDLIKQSAQTQAGSVSKISEMMDLLNNVSQQNLRLFNHTTDACKSLNQTAESAEALTNRFILTADTTQERLTG
ncbi:methyl-accepting chemotaxis protein [Aliishimia ponticola]|nr:methyl-accepting chemotaxis protein [Aliishimia ponticola]